MNRLRQITENRSSCGAAWPFRASATRVRPTATNRVSAILRGLEKEAPLCSAVAGGEVRSPFSSVVVPVDGQLYAEHGLTWALGIAARLGVPLRLLHIGSESTSSDAGDVYLGDLVARLNRVSSIPLATYSVQAPSIVDALRSVVTGDELIVTALPRRRRFELIWRREKLNDFVQRLPAPSLVVRGSHKNVELTAVQRITHMLLPLDGSARAEQVISPALALSRGHGADYTLVRLLPALKELANDLIEASAPTALPKRLETEAWDYLRRTSHRLEQAIGVQPRLVVDEQPVVGGIVRYARAERTDIIALASRGRERRTRLFQGSVAERVLRRTTVPVLVVPTH